MRFAGRASLAAVLATALIAAASAASSAAQTPGQVTGLTVEQADGFATLSWTPVAGATEYQIERTPAGAPGTGGSGSLAAEPPDQPGPAGLRRRRLQPGRQLPVARPRPLRHRAAAVSEPVSGTTQPEFGDPGTAGENLRTQWEETNAAVYTNDVNEYAYTAALDAASERVRVVEIGRTVLGRPINMFIIGYPAPKPTAPRSPATRLRC